MLFISNINIAHSAVNFGR